MALIQMSVMSASLMRTVDVNVILPADKLVWGGQPAPEGPFPTLYLLHGVFGSQYDWLTGTRLQSWAEERNLAVVMPAGENRFYLDEPETNSYYGVFVGQELVDLTRRMFPLSTRREDTYLAGLSMGGYGALRNGLKYAETFGAVAGLSVANLVDGIEHLTNDTPIFFQRRDYVERCFGPVEQVPGSDKDILALARGLRERGEPFPKLFLACGTEDPLLEGNRRLRDGLTGLGCFLYYEEGPGAHEWDFWDRTLLRLLNWLPLEAAPGVSSGNVGL